MIVKAVAVDTSNNWGKVSTYTFNITDSINVNDKINSTLIQKIQDLDKKISPIAEEYPDYCIKGTLYCGMELPNGDDFYSEVCSEHIRKDHVLDVSEWQLSKDVHLPWKALREEKLSYPMYCLLEEHRMALDEVIGLTEDNFYIEIKIELT